MLDDIILALARYMMKVEADFVVDAAGNANLEQALAAFVTTADTDAPVATRFVFLPDLVAPHVGAGDPIVTIWFDRPVLSANLQPAAPTPPPTLVTEGAGAKRRMLEFYYFVATIMEFY